MNRLAEEMFSKGEADFATARREVAVTDHPNHDAVCFHSQQCIEKLMKAVLFDRSAPPPRTHNLKSLIEMIQSLGVAFDPAQDDIECLLPGAVDYRYPGESADSADAIQALEACTRVRARLHELLGKS